MSQTQPVGPDPDDEPDEGEEVTAHEDDGETGDD
jgi:hypothetical protein